MQYLSTKSIILDVVDNWSDELSISNNFEMWWIKITRSISNTFFV